MSCHVFHDLKNNNKNRGKNIKIQNNRNFGEGFIMGDLYSHLPIHVPGEDSEDPDIIKVIKNTFNKRNTSIVGDHCASCPL